MNYINTINTFHLNSDKNNKSNINSKDENEYHNESRISFQLSLRKQKIKEKINQRRDFNLLIDNSELGKINNIILTDEDILSGKYYDDLENLYNIKDELSLRKKLNALGCYLREKIKNNINPKDILLKANSSYNIKNNIKNENLPLGSLLLKIGINTSDKMVYIFCFNYLLYFICNYNDFCKELINEKILNEIFEKLIKFYPCMIENNKKNKNLQQLFNINTDIKSELIESYIFGNTILKILGNLLIISDSYKPFEAINFHEKIIYLLSVFELDYKNEKFLIERIDYLDTLIWLIYLFLKKVEDTAINYKDKILSTIPYILDYLNSFNLSKDIDIIEKIIELIENISDINDIFNVKIIECEGLNIFSNIIKYYCTNNYINNKEYENDLINEIINRILYIIVNIFLLDSKYLKNIDYLNFFSSFEALFNYNINNHTNKEIEDKLVHLLGVLACFDDIEQIIQYFLLNKNIIDNLYKNYNECNKLEILLFIDNIMTKQKKDVCIFIIDMGAIDIIKNNIFNYNINDKNIFESTINTFLKIIQFENSINNKLFFNKLELYSIIDKIKEIYINNKFTKENEKIIQLIIEKFDKL